MLRAFARARKTRLVHVVLIILWFRPIIKHATVCPTFTVLPILHVLSALYVVVTLTWSHRALALLILYVLLCAHVRLAKNTKLRRLQSHLIASARRVLPLAMLAIRWIHQPAVVRLRIYLAFPVLRVPTAPVQAFLLASHA